MHLGTYNISRLCLRPRYNSPLNIFPRQTTLLQRQVTTFKIFIIAHCLLHYSLNTFPPPNTVPPPNYNASLFTLKRRRRVFFMSMLVYLFNAGTSDILIIIFSSAKFGSLIDYSFRCYPQG